MLCVKKKARESEEVEEEAPVSMAVVKTEGLQEAMLMTYCNALTYLSTGERFLSYSSKEYKCLSLTVSHRSNSYHLLGSTSCINHVV